MIQLLFEALNPFDNVTLGPAPWFRITGEVMQDSSGLIVSKYTNRFWEVLGRYFTRYSCQGQSLIHFEDANGKTSEAFGPFEQFFLVDGVARAGLKRFATFSEDAQRWHHHDTNTHWPVMVITSVD